MPSDIDAPLSLHVTDFKPWKCFCSCGEVTLVSFDQKKGEYVPQDKTWKYSPDTNWYCGKSGHRKGNQIKLNKISDYATTLSKDGESELNVADAD